MTSLLAVDGHLLTMYDRLRQKHECLHEMIGRWKSETRRLTLIVNCRNLGHEQLEQGWSVHEELQMLSWKTKRMHSLYLLLTEEIGRFKQESCIENFKFLELESGGLDKSLQKRLVHDFEELEEIQQDMSSQFDLFDQKLNDRVASIESLIDDQLADIQRRTEASKSKRKLAKSYKSRPRFLRTVRRPVTFKRLRSRLTLVRRSSGLR